MSGNRLVNGTAFLLWAIVARRIESLVGEQVADTFLSDLRQYLNTRGADQFAELLSGPTTLAKANTVLGQACDLFEQRITARNLQHLQRFTRVSLRNIDELQFALNAFDSSPNTTTLESVVRQHLLQLYGDDPAARVHLDEALALFMDCLELALVAQGSLVPLHLKLDDVLFELRSQRAAVPRATIDSDPLNVPPEALFAREAEAAAIISALTADRGRQSDVVMLYGPLGAGKSALARAVGHKLHAEAVFDTVIIENFQFHDKEDTIFDKFVSVLESKLGTKTIDGPADSRAVRLRNELRGQSLLYIVDDVEHDVTQRIVAYVCSLSEPHFRVIIVQNTEPYSPQCTTVLIEELKLIEHVRLFLNNRCGDLQLDVSQLQRILNATQGNLIALEELAKLFITEGLDKVLPNIETHIAKKDGPIAQKWLDFVLRSLSLVETYVVYALCLFKRTADVDMVIDVIRTYQRERADEEKRSAFDERTIRNAVKDLVARGTVVATPEADRYALKSTFLAYVRQELKLHRELEGWRKAWSVCYLNLRPRQQNNDDEAGWTIMIDYTPNGVFRVNPAHADEAYTIRDVIEYCVSPNRFTERWIDAAKLLDSFRATLFATGHWQVRVEAGRLVMEQAARAELWHLEGQLKRLLAWMDCYRGQYGPGEKLAEDSYKLACKYVARARTQSERIIHSQTLYKSLITLGQIALRQGQESSIKGHYRQHSDEVLADNFFRVAREQFSAARRYFHHAQMYVRFACPFAGEALIVEFHLAEVEYYDRHSLTMMRDQRLLFDRLTYAHELFVAILTQAHQLGHKRLEAHARYYVGKACRRIASHRNLVADSEVSFSDARNHLEDAQSIADKFNDTILLGRIAFALGQYYESLTPANIGKDQQREEHLSQARSFVLQAIKIFDSDKMTLEMQDAQYFLEQRLRVVEP